ncbi:DUF6456 domain-containing protein [Neorhizobium alkalisoli]|nr:DUF6456 domain-containing protein [Neorhizobium alkalisoli]
MSKNLNLPHKTSGGDPAAAGRKALIVLMRHLLQGACAVENMEEGQICLTGVTRRHHPEETLAQALSLGLAERQGDRIAASATATSFIRRAMAEREEAFLTQHREVETATMEVEGSRQPVRINLAESPLGAVARLKDRDGGPFMPPMAVEAGERLLSDFTRGQMQPRITASWEPRLSSRAKGSAGGKVDITDSALAARTRFSDAMEAMGPELSGVAIDVCCFGKGLELVERERQWPARSAKLMLRTALLALARHYDPPRPDVRRRSHHWGADGFRPVL